ncbi:hypothetical protein ACVWWN_004494 [Mycobacterium sp. URHB0021]
MPNGHPGNRQDQLAAAFSWLAPPILAALGRHRHPWTSPARSPCGRVAQTATGQAHISHPRRYSSTGRTVRTTVDLIATATVDRGRALGQQPTARPCAQLHRHRPGQRCQAGVGGENPKDQPRGWFVSPTVFADVDNTDRIAREEIFGPVVTVIAYDFQAEAIDIANDSEFGLGGSVWSTDSDRATEVARQVATGTIGLNGYQLDIAAPFGGVKGSGVGRELGPEGLAAYQHSNRSTTCSRPADAQPTPKRISMHNTNHVFGHDQHEFERLMRQDVEAHHTAPVGQGRRGERHASNRHRLRLRRCGDARGRACRTHRSGNRHRS